MCKLNVYMIDKFVPGIDVKEVFNHHHHKAFENINDEIELTNYDDKYNYYQASAKRCDCSSVVGMLVDYKGKFDSYIEYLNSIDKGDIVALYNIKSLLQEPNYDSKLSSVLATRDRMFGKLEKYTTPIREAEAKLSELTVSAKPNIQDQIAIKKLSSEIVELRKALENNQDYKSQELLYNEFIKANELLISSRNYTLENKQDWWQKNIDGAINKAEHECHIKVNAEYNHLKNILKGVLKLTDEVKLFSFMQEDDCYEYNNLEEVKTVKIDELTMEDFLFLDVRQVITITR